jgi:carbonic anhydrase/acetyltransferase-like protein (isoleucine patch superfamily)
MSTDKYKLRLDLKLELGSVTLFRIERLSDGELGGYIEKEENLSQIGDAWVSGSAQVYGNAQVYGDAQVFGDAQVYGNARVSGDAWVYGDAQVYGNARVSGDAWVYGDAQVSGDARVYGDAQVSGSAQVYGNAQVSGDAQVYGDAQVFGNARVSSITELVNFIIAFKFSITITPDNIAIGCQLKTRKEWLKVTQKQAVEMGLPKEMYSHYKALIKAGMLLVPARKTKGIK